MCKCKYCSSELKKGGELDWMYLWCANNRCSVFLNSIKAKNRQRYAEHFKTGDIIPFNIVGGNYSNWYY